MSSRRLITALAVMLGLALVLVPLTAGGQEGRDPGAKPGTPAPENRATEPSGTFNGWDGDGPAPRTLVHSGDSTIQGGLCVGFDCSANEPMGFATIKIEENNLRIAAADSSTVSGFPTTDWQIEFNSSSSGGGNYFMVRDCGSGGAAGSVDSTCGGTPMLTIEGGADNESIHVDSSGNQGGNVGFGTANPVVDLHALSGNTPTLRLEQDNSSGFTPQSWDMAGNESNFFIRDVTNGSALPFRIEPGTASNTLYLDNNERIGIGTTAPEGALHVRMAGTVLSYVQSSNDGAVQFRLRSDSANRRFLATNGADVVQSQIVFGDNAEIRLTGTNDTAGNGAALRFNERTTAPAAVGNTGAIYVDVDGSLCYVSPTTVVDLGGGFTAGCA